MTRKAVVLAICKNNIWKETAKYLKHYRMKYLWDIDSYNKKASKIIGLYREIEFKIDNDGFKISKFEYRDLIKEFEKEIK